MAYVSPEAFREALRELSDEAFATLVADLYRARGHEVRIERRETAAVVVVDDGDARRRLLVHRPRRVLRRGPNLAAADADGIVTDAAAPRRGVDDGAEVVDADRLRELVLFGIDRTDRAALFDRLGVSPATPDVASGPPPRSGLATVRRSHLAVAVVALALIAVALVGFPGDTGGAIDASASGSIDDRVTAFRSQGTVPAADTTTTTATGTSTVDRNASALLRYPVGLAERGISSGVFLARNHGRLLESASFRLVVTRQEFVDGNRTGYRREVIYAASPRRAYSTLEENGTFRGRTFVSDGGSFYVNGSVAFVRSNGTVERIPVPEDGGGSLAGYAASAVNILLPANTSAGVVNVSRNGTTFYRVPFAVNRTFNQRNVTGYAVVDDDGLVRDVRRRWELEGSNLTVVVRFRTIPGNVTFRRPDWLESHLERERNATTTEGGARPGAAAALRPAPALPAEVSLVRTAPGRDQPGLQSRG